MLMRLTDEEWTVIVILSPVLLWPCLPQGAGTRRMCVERHRRLTPGEGSATPWLSDLKWNSTGARSAPIMTLPTL
jgi:hypothetical protein